MISPSSLLRIVHLIGLCLAVGAASAKVALLLRSRTDAGLLPTFLRVADTLTRLILLGMLLLVGSGIAWLVLGYPFSARLIVKLVLVALMPVTGALIDRKERQLRTLLPATGEASSPALLSAAKRYRAIELSATGLLYLIILIWVLR